MPFTYFYLLIWERGERQSVVPLIYAFIGCFLYVAWLEIEPATLVYRDDTLYQLRYPARASTAYFKMLVDNMAYLILHCGQQLSIHKPSDRIVISKLLRRAQMSSSNLCTQTYNLLPEAAQVAGNELRKQLDMFPRKILRPVNYQNWKLQVEKSKEQQGKTLLIDRQL